MTIGDAPHAFTPEIGNDALGVRALLGGLRIDHRAVLRSDVVALAIERRRVVDREKHPEQVGVRQHGRIELDAHDFGVAGVSAAHLVVGRVRRSSAGVAGFDRHDALELVEDRFEAPETSSAEHRRLRVSWVNSWWIIAVEHSALCATLAFLHIVSGRERRYLHALQPAPSHVGEPGAAMR